MKLTKEELESIFELISLCFILIIIWKLKKLLIEITLIV